MKFCLILISIEVLILITNNPMNCFCDRNVSEIENNLNETKLSITQLNSNNSSNNLFRRIDSLGRIRITNGFLMRTLFVVKNSKKYFNLL
jgi:hypothetical protein